MPQLELPQLVRPPPADGAGAAATGTSLSPERRGPAARGAGAGAGLVIAAAASLLGQDGRGKGGGGGGGESDKSMQQRYLLAQLKTKYWAAAAAASGTAGGGAGGASGATGRQQQARGRAIGRERRRLASLDTTGPLPEGLLNRLPGRAAVRGARSSPEQQPRPVSAEDPSLSLYVSKSPQHGGGRAGVTRSGSQSPGGERGGRQPHHHSPTSRHGRGSGGGGGEAGRERAGSVRLQAALALYQRSVTVDSARGGGGGGGRGRHRRSAPGAPSPTHGDAVAAQRQRAGKGGDATAAGAAAAPAFAAGLMAEGGVFLLGGGGGDAALAAATSVSASGAATRASAAELAAAAVAARKASEAAAAAAAAEQQQGGGSPLAARRGRGQVTRAHSQSRSPSQRRSPSPGGQLESFQIVQSIESGLSTLPVDFLRRYGLDRALVAMHVRLAKMCQAFSRHYRRLQRERVWRAWRLHVLASRAGDGDTDRPRAALTLYVQERGLNRLEGWCQRRRDAALARRLRRWAAACARIKAAEAAAHRRRAAHIIASALLRWRHARRRMARRVKKRAVERAKVKEGHARAAAMAAALRVEQRRHSDVQKAARVLHSRQTAHRRLSSASLIQKTWRRYKSRVLLLAHAEVERAALAAARAARREALWLSALAAPVTAAVGAAMTVGARAAATKTRAAAARDRARYRRVAAGALAEMTEASVEVQRRWRGYYGRWQYLEALWRVRRLQGWARAALSRWHLKAELSQRIAARRQREEEAAAERVRVATAQRAAAAGSLQRWGRRCVGRARLRARFETRAMVLEAARDNRQRLLVAMLIQQGPAWGIWDHLPKADRRALVAAVGPHDAAARTRAKCRALGQPVTSARPPALAAALVGQDAEKLHAALVLQGWVARRRAARALTRAIATRARLRRQHAEAVALARRHAAATVLARAWTSRHLRREVQARVVATWVARREAASRRLQRLCRYVVGMNRLRERFAVRRIIIMEQIRHDEMDAAARAISRWYRERLVAYNALMRVVARNALAARERAAQAAAAENRRHAAAARLQRWWRRLSALWRLARRVKRGAWARQRASQRRAEEAAARALQSWARRRAARAALRARFVAQAKKLRDKRAADAKAAREAAAALTLQRWARRLWSRRVMRLRFAARAAAVRDRRTLVATHAAEVMRMREDAAAAALTATVERTKLEAALALESSSLRRSEAECRAQMLAAWKISFDKGAKRNVWTNYITGAKAVERPEGWVVNPDDRWTTQEDEHGFLKHLDHVSGDLCWCPPCAACRKHESTKVCTDKECKSAASPLCDACFARCHPPPKARNHPFAPAPSAREAPAAKGDAMCVNCAHRVAAVVCRACGGDALCARCSHVIHRTGRRRAHVLVPCVEARRGWQVVEPRTEGEKVYYFNATSGEQSTEKPESLMLAGELEERRKCADAREAASKQLNRAERLQQLLEQVVLERDGMQVELAQLRKDVEQLQKDLESAKANAVLGGTTETEKLAYRKELLLSRGQRVQLGQEIKLKANQTGKVSGAATASAAAAVLGAGVGSAPTSPRGGAASKARGG